MLLKERSDIMKKRKSKHSEDDEIPKALRNMKKNNKDKKFNYNCYINIRNITRNICKHMEKIIGRDGKK